jgi:AAA+ ATPase superfamily predicted ATPase
MLSTTNQQENANSFLGLQSYTEAQSNFFFGRNAETDTLTSLVQLNTLTIVFGRSGTGKTSLLNAGVFPRLRKNFCLPFRIRLEFNENSQDLIGQVKKVLKEEIDKYGFKVESYPGTETLWEYFHKEPLWKTVTPILVFDQFEEIFTLARSNVRFATTELPLFWEELSDLVENNIPEKLKPKFLEQKDEFEYNYKKQKTKIQIAANEWQPGLRGNYKDLERKYQSL